MNALTIFKERLLMKIGEAKEKADEEKKTKGFVYQSTDDWINSLYDALVMVNAAEVEAEKEREKNPYWFPSTIAPSVATVVPANNEDE